RRARTHLRTLGFDGVVEYHVGEAVQTLRQTAGTFDLIFNDIDKEGYPASLPVVTEKLRPGGVLIVDNMFWHGQIFDAKDQTEETEGVRRLTTLITSDPGWISSIVPLRDGLLVAYRAGRYRPWPRAAAQILAGVRGMSRWRTPYVSSAPITAFTTAEIEPTV